MALAYAAVGPSGSGRRDEQSRQNAWKKRENEKIASFQEKKKTGRRGIGGGGALGSDGGELTAH